MSRQTMRLLLALLLFVIALALLLDILAPPGRTPRLLTIFDLPGMRAGGRATPRLGQPRPQQLSHVVGALAGFVALAGYGLLLRYCLPARLARLVRALDVTNRLLAHRILTGAATVVLLVALAGLAAISVIAGPLALLLLAALVVAALTGLVALGFVLGRRLRVWAGAPEPSAFADLAAGLLALITLALLPWLGLPALALATAAGIGTIAVTRFGSSDRWEVAPFEY